MKYDDSYPTCAETYATLCIYHEDLDPEELDRLLDLHYTWSCRKGDPILKKEPERASRKLGAWLLRTEGKLDSKDSRRHVDWLLDLIEEKAEVLEALRNKGYRTNIGCYWLSKHGEGGPTVSIEQSERLARLGIELDFDVYFGGDNESS